MNQQAIQSQFDLRAPRFETSAAWVSDEGLLQSHLRVLRADQKVELLDICCGTGIVGAAFRGRAARLVGVDISEVMLKQAGEKLDAVYRGTSEALPFPDASFDITVCRQSLHFADAPRAVAEMYRVLQPGGQAIISQRVPYGASDAQWMEKINRAKQPLLRNFFHAEDLQNLLKRAGFREVVMDEYHLWENVNHWIDTPETTPQSRAEIIDLYRNAPPEFLEAHPVEISADGTIRDRWRWALCSGLK